VLEIDRRIICFVLAGLSVQFAHDGIVRLGRWAADP
jgi:hypothetical protein